MLGNIIKLISALIAVLSCGIVLAADGLDAARELHRAGELEPALSVYRGIIEDEAQPAADRAAAANNACVILLDTGRYEAALAACTTARDLRRAGNDFRRLARTLNNLGAVLEALGDYDTAGDVYAEALALNRDANDIESVAINLGNLGVLATQAGNFGSALRYHGEAMRLAEAALPADWARDQLALAAINRGVVLERVGAYREALDSYRAAAASEERLSVPQRAALRLNIGVVYRNLGDPVRALREYDTAADLYTSQDDAAGLARVWLDRGIVWHFAYRDYERARQAYRHADRLARERQAFDERLQAMYFLGRLALDTGDVAGARAGFAATLVLARDHAAREAQWSAMEGLARVAIREARLDDATGVLQQAMTLIEQTRAGIDRAPLREAFFGSQRSVYALAVAADWQLWRRSGDQAAIRNAYAIAQRAKARELLATLPQAPPPLDALAVRERLDTALLEFFAGEDALYGWYLDASGVQGHRWPDEDPLRADLEALVQQSGPLGPALGRRLYGHLLAPFAGRLSQTDRLIVAPDRVLFRLPFEALGNETGMLLDSHVVTYAPSGSIAAGLTPATGYRRELTAIGAPDSEAPADAAWPYDLPPLPEAAAELQTIASLVPGEAHVIGGSQASEASALQLLREGAAIAHFATHTLLDDRLGAAIVLRPEDDADGLLTAPELVAAAPLPLGLVVLAACRSGLGGFETGHALNSLSGALLAAGSGAVLATIRDVDDGYSRVFMQAFYRDLVRGRRPADALQRTKQTMRAAAADQTWDAYVLIGDPQAPIPWRPRYGWLFAGVLLMLGAIVAALRAGSGIQSSSRSSASAAPPPS